MEHLLVFDDEPDLDDEISSSFMKFPQEVRNAIQQVLLSSDPLDDPDFRAVDYINNLFPTEQSLSNVDETIESMKVKICQLGEEMRTFVREQMNVGKDGIQLLEEGQKAICQLFIRIKDIENKAERSEHMVREITRDIKRLDHAKHHLTYSITTLNQLCMLVEGVDTLKELTRKRKYGEMVNLLQGVMDVHNHFQKYVGIPQIRKLSDEVQTIKEDLAQQILSDFHSAFAGPNAKNLAPPQWLEEACLIVSILDHKVKQDLLKWFVSLQLAEYSRLFRADEEIAWLDKIECRYAWLRKHLIELEGKFGRVFPIDWEIGERVAVGFCHITRKELDQIMTTRVKDIDVTLLLHAIQRTTNFESALSRVFTGITLEGISFASAGKPEKYTKSFEDTESTKSFSEDMEKEEKEALPIPVDLLKTNPFRGIISRCFESRLNIYVEAHDRNLSRLIDKFVEDLQKDPLPHPETADVLPSCVDLFVCYKKCLVQCAQISTGPPMLDLSKTFQRHLLGYGTKVLQKGLPKVGGNSSSGLISNFQSFLKEGDATRLTHAELCRLCSILITADYCLETTQQLEGKLKEKVDFGLAPKINFNAEQDMFHRIIKHCIQLLVQDLETACEPALVSMGKIQWAAVDIVGDQSGYVTTIMSHLHNTLPLLRTNLATSRKYFTQLCMHFANSFVPKFINSLFKCKPISPVGAEQLLLDTHMLKTVLMDLPLLGSQVPRTAPASYTKTVVKSMTKAEMILKVVMVPHDSPDDFVDNYIKLLSGLNFLEFQRILEMKGLKRHEQKILTDKFLMKVPSSQAITFPTGGSTTVQLLSALTNRVSEHESNRTSRLEKLIKIKL